MMVSQKKERLNQILFLLLIFIAGISVVTKETYALYDKLSLYIMALFSVGLTALNFRFSKKYWIFVALFSVYLIGSILYNGGGMGSVVTAVVSVLMLYSYFSFQPDRISVHVLEVFSVVGVLFLFGLSFPYGKNYDYYAYEAINPNVLGMFLIYFFMMGCSITTAKPLVRRIVIPILAVLVALGLYHYGSRGSMLAFGLFLVLNLIPKKFMTKRKVIIAACAVIVLGILFPIVYVLLFRNGVEFQIFGKNFFTGRQRIWNNMFDKLNESPLNWLFGIGSNQVLWEGAKMNVHNNYFAVLVNSGVIGVVLYYGFLMTVFIKAAKGLQSNDRTRRLLYMFISSALLLGIFEITTLWTTTYPFAFFGLGTAYGLTQYENLLTGESGT